MLTCVIDAIEGRDVATVDIPGAFMQSEMEGNIHMKLQGVMAEVIMKLDTKKYEKFVQENGQDTIYVKLTKALYGTLQAALLFWQNLSSKLQEWGFEINPYDFCVANKEINGKQCTIAWHVEDLKISHVDHPKAVTSVINLLDATYGQEIVGGKRAAVTFTRGKLHDCLGMLLNYSESGAVKIDMTAYLRKIHEKMPEDINGTATSPVAAYLFTIKEGIEELDEEQKEFFMQPWRSCCFCANMVDPTYRQQSLFYVLGFNNQPNMTTTNSVGSLSIFVQRRTSYCVSAQTI
jgi:hypothetical protein